ncbi:hypothetical protein PAHAL_2G404600 [Panicum hallii]|uniref:F-box domain-containing protein n=1 Tax=Panicum hallii TaxID=206008 RepID=A0A2S3H358_9POAL|nr:hypothetical protein PAHAL_2G404600 [Panicum hallii]
MAAEAGDDGLRRLPPGPGPGPDRISALPDELIQAILAWLPSTAAAARTSAVSRRWRHVWTGVPALSFHVEQKPLREYSSTDAALDAALDAYSDSAALSRLTIDVDGPSPAPRIAPWLRFASLRLAGELRLTLKGGAPKQPVMMGPLVHHPIAMGPFVHQPVLLAIGDLMQQLELPACERATRIDLAGINFALRLPPAGAFAALRILRISVTDLVRGDVGHLVSTQCPRLRDLELCGVTLEAANLSISSASLERLVLRRVSIKNEGRIDVAAPSMYYLALDNCGGRSVAVTIATAMLAELIWNHAYDPRLHKLEGADRQIYRLVATYGSNAALFRRFDAVDELCLRLSMLSKPAECKKFVREMDKLPKTKVLEVKGLSTKQHFEPVMLHLLRKHNRLVKIKVDLFPANLKEINYCLRHGCTCVPPVSWTTDDVVLDSLEEVEISSFTGAVEEVELLKLLFGCNIKIRRLAIHTASGVSLSQEMQKRIWGLARPHCISLEFETTQFSR